MSRYRYEGTGPCRVGCGVVQPGDVIETDTNPGRRFVLIQEKKVPIRLKITQKPTTTVAVDDTN